MLSVLQDEDFAVPRNPRTGWREFGTHRVSHDAQGWLFDDLHPLRDSLNGHASFSQRERVSDAAEYLREQSVRLGALPVNFHRRIFLFPTPSARHSVPMALSLFDSVSVSFASMPRPPDICTLNSRPTHVCEFHVSVPRVDQRTVVENSISSR